MLRKGRLLFLVDCAVILLGAALLIGPLWHIEYFKNWATIDSTFIADARFLKEHWPHPRWLPLWYCGTRFDFIYPPALRYGTALLAMLGGISTARAYHIYTAIFYCLGCAGVYALLRVAGAARVWAWIGAAAAVTLSPSFLLMRTFREDALLRMPQRLNVLVKWGEGPHMSALALLPFALLFSWSALRDGGKRRMAAAAISCALLVATNFYGATALAVLFPLACWSLWITQGGQAVLQRAAAILLLGYGLAAFWLTPSYVRVTLDNLKLVAAPGSAWSRWVALGVAVLFAWLSAKCARGRKERAWPVFITGAALIFLLLVVGHYYFNFRVTGEPHRLVPELDLVLILAAIEGLRILAAGGRPWRRVAAAGAVVAAFAAALPYLSRPWAVFAGEAEYRARPEYRLTEWIAKNLPGTRIFATGSPRLWYNAWFDGEQVDGGSEQGLRNNLTALARWQLTKDPPAGRDRDVAWLVALGADAVIVPQPVPEEMYHEFTAPEKFSGLLPVIYDDGHGNILYRAPRRGTVRARVVDRQRMARLRPIPFSDYDREELAAYAAAVESGPDRAVALRWEGTDAIRLRAAIHPGEALLVQENYDPAWRAYAGGRSIGIAKDAAGFMLVDAPPGEQEIRLVFALPWDNAVGRAISALAAVVALLWLRPRRAGA